MWRYFVLWLELLNVALDLFHVLSQGFHLFLVLADGPALLIDQFIQVIDGIFQKSDAGF